MIITTLKLPVRWRVGDDNCRDVQQCFVNSKKLTIYLLNFVFLCDALTLTPTGVGLNDPQNFGGMLHKKNVNKKYLKSPVLFTKFLRRHSSLKHFSYTCVLNMF